jgi:hypothetical protein
MDKNRRGCVEPEVRDRRENKEEANYKKSIFGLA